LATTIVEPLTVIDGDSSASAVSWRAIFAGAAAAIATTLILLELGVGLGLSAASPWRDVGATAATLGVAGGIWLVIVQWLSAAMGGYLAGRLRRKWAGLHGDEVFFRDTAHGFLSWCAATVIAVIVVAMAATAAVDTTAKAVGPAVAGATQGAAQGATQSAKGASVDDYFIDTLFRSSETANAPSGVATPAADQRGEVTRIFVRDLANAGNLTPEDRTYVARAIAARTGTSQAEAEKRVDDTVAKIKSAETQAREAADKARKAAAAAAIVTSLAMVIGAFIASVAGALGGKLRDEY
jgi:hypothetical protein